MANGRSTPGRGGSARGPRSGAATRARRASTSTYRSTTRGTSGRHQRKSTSPNVLGDGLKRTGLFVAEQSDEVWGWLALALGVAIALGIYLSVLGLVGHGVRRVGADLFGWGDDVAPIALILGGMTLAFGRARRGPLGMLASFSFLLIAATTLAEIAAGSPSVHASLHHLGGAGGLLGAAVGGGLRALLGAIGGVIVALVIAAVAICGLLGLSIVDALRSVVTTTGELFTEARERREERRNAAEVAEREDELAARVTFDDPFDPFEELEDDEHLLALPHDIEIAGTLDIDDLAAGFVSEELVDADELDEGAGPFAVADGAVGHAPSLDEVVPIGEQLTLVPSRRAWKLPPPRLLSRTKRQELDRKAVEERGHTLERALRTHGVETRLVDYTVGPTVTRFVLELGEGVKVARVTSLAKDIAYAMASPDVRILAPIPGRQAIGVEVPNVDRQLVSLGDVLISEEARRATHPLEVAFGRDIDGRAVMANLAEMPHLLIAGATGAGKSSAINSIITSVLMRSRPDQVRLMLVDPKRVELGQYNGLPHLITPVVVNPKRAANALQWAVKEMEHRYDILAEVGVRDITGYNAAYDRGDFAPVPYEDDEGNPIEVYEGDDESLMTPENRPPITVIPDAPNRQRMEFILIVVDELNDLMMVAARDVEESICRIAQMARAVGIHLVIATQRPSVDVITGVIKANVPSRLAFSVSSLADSRVILDQGGAERLVGRGDLLLLTASSSIPRRLQAPWVSEDEVRDVVAHWKRQGTPDFIEGVVGEDGPGASEGRGANGDDDELYLQALEIVVRSGLGSTSMLQRKLRVGFARAGRLMDLLEQHGVVGPSEGSKARAVLMSPDELDLED